METSWNVGETAEILWDSGAWWVDGHDWSDLAAAADDDNLFSDLYYFP